MSATDRETPPNEGVYFKQALSGVDFAVDDQIASQMVNFAYAIGDYSSRECVLVDPAYRPGELIDLVEADGFEVVGVLATHYHADHVGGDLFGHSIAGIAGLLERIDVGIHIQQAEQEWIQRTTGVSASHFKTHQPGDTVRVGSVDITLVHTPGHTPGSQCFLVDGRLVAGDTLFLDGCGRTDLPGSDPAAMMESLATLYNVADDVILFPGHRYSPAGSAPMAAVKANNWVFQSIER